MVPAGLRHGPACFAVWAWPPSWARGLWSPHRGNQRLHPGSLGLADSAGEYGATADPGASWTPAFLPLTTQWRPSGAPPGHASQGRPALPPGPTGLLYQPARGLGLGSACACPATVLPGLSPGADPGAHSFSARGSPGPRQVLGVSASSGKNPKCCGKTRRGCAHSVSSPGESAGRAPRARPAAAQDQGRDAQADQEAQGFDSALAARSTTPRLDEKSPLPWRPRPLPVMCGRLLRMGRL